MTRGAETRQRMIRTAIDLFHRHGIHATSVDQILEQSGTGKSQFAHYFKNKEGLIHAVLQSFYGKLRANESPFKMTIESWQDLEEWFHQFVRYQQRTGCERSCAVGTIGADLSSDQELLRQDARMAFDLMSRPLVNFFTVLKARKQLRPGCEPQALADFCFSIMQGGLLVGKIRRETEPFENSIHHALKYLKSVAGHRAG
jgi:TetR/AcrR family transcriptional regulator, transcriptional repressor for nem operon